MAFWIDLGYGDIPQLIEKNHWTFNRYWQLQHLVCLKKFSELDDIINVFALPIQRFCLIKYGERVDVRLMSCGVTLEELFALQIVSVLFAVLLKAVAQFAKQIRLQNVKTATTTVLQKQRIEKIERLTHSVSM